MYASLKFIIALISFVASNELNAQTVASASAAKAPSPTAHQIAQIEAALQPMVVAIESLKNYQLEVSTQHDINPRGKLASFNTNFKLWNSVPDKFYMISQSGRLPTPLLNVSAFGDGIKTTLYLAEGNLYMESADAYESVRQSLLVDINPFVGLLLNSALRANLLSLQTPDQAVVSVSDAVFEGVACKKVTLGLPPEDLTYYHPVAPPHLPIALINNGTVPVSMRITSRLKWNPQSSHPDSIFTPALPAAAKKVESRQEFMTEVEKVTQRAIQFQIQPTSSRQSVR